MKSAFAAVVSALGLCLSACGGGGGGGDATPPAATPVTATFIESGSVFVGAPPLTLPGSRLIQNQAELNQVLARMRPGTVRQPALTNPNFSLVSIIYLEGDADRDPSSSLAVTNASHAADGAASVNVEYCGTGPVVGGEHRSYAFYSVPAQTGAAGFSVVSRQLPMCVSRTRVPSTLIAAGDANLAFPPGDPIRIIRTLTDWMEIQQRMPPGSVPAAYLNPDFSRVTIIFLQGLGDNTPTSYVLLVNVLSGSGVQFVSSEYCWPQIVFIANHSPFAAYVVDVLGTDVRVEAVDSAPPNCAIAR